VKNQTKKSGHAHRKRHGEHQKRTGHFLKVYTPYLPVVIFFILSFWLLKPYYRTATPAANPEVLAYSTDIANNTLLTATNQKRTASGVASLAYNAKLTSAAQTKANDMATRNYWSHNTPEGTPPWAFITNAGYSYSIAGENLAYGFRITNTNTSTNEIGVIDGWMASPTHKENLLNGKFTEVGFGIANAPSYQGLSQQTIVVAMYATPLQASAAPAQKTTPAPVAASTAPTTAAPAAQTSTQATAQAITDQNDTTKSSATTTEPALTAQPKTVSRIEATTNKSLPWLLSTLFVIALSGGALLITKHSYALHQYVTKGKNFFFRNKLLDITIIAFIAFYLIASQTIVKVL
jgi:uncharacterized protein YkwD